jgi:hypothetical protein
MKKLLFLLMLLPITAAAQTHTFPAEDTNNTFTGTNIFTSSLATALAQYTVGTLPNATTTSPTREIVVVTDGQSASDCTSGGGSTAALCRTNGTSWVSLTGAGLFSGSCTTNQIVYGTASNTLGCSNSLKWTPSGTTGAAALTNTTAATNVNNQNTPSLTLAGTAWNGAASIADTWLFQSTLGGGTNPTSTLAIAHSGSSGIATVSMPDNVSVGSLNANGNVTANGGLGSAEINGGPGLFIQGNTPATSMANVSSGAAEFIGEYWTGAASSDDNWKLESVLGSGSNPTSTLTLSHTGGSGAALFDDGGLSNHAVVEYCGATTGATQACAKTVQTGTFTIYGDVLLNTATSQSITTLPFTGALYSCSGSDLTSAAGVVSFNTYASSSVTIVETGGANTDHLRYMCVGK